MMSITANRLKLLFMRRALVCKRKAKLLKLLSDVFVLNSKRQKRVSLNGGHPFFPTTHGHDLFIDAAR